MSTPYGRSKWEAEQALAHVDGAVTILRAPMVYGPDAPGNYERLVRLAERGLPLPFGATANARSMIHVENLAHCVVHVLERTDAAGTYLVCDADPISTTQLVQAIQASRGLSSRLVRVPKTLVTALGRITGRTAMVDKLWGDLVLDASRAHDDLGWTPPLTVTEALRRLD